MPAPEDRDFFQILGGQDREAVIQLLARLDPWLHRIVRLHIAAFRMRQVLDTADVLQSLLKDFLGRLRGDQQLREQPQLERYLVGAVRKKILGRFRKERRYSRDLGELPELADSCASVTRLVEERDYVTSVRNHLSTECRRLFDLRMNDQTWPEISVEAEERADALRMRLRRAVAAAILHLNHEDSDRAG